MNTNSPSLLLSLASRQVWPQILAVAHLKPEKVVLLHSAELDHSEMPAKNLQKFFIQARLVSPGLAMLEHISHDDFAAVEKRLKQIADQLESRSDCPDRSEWALNFTGGNKLMAMAAFRWASQNGIRSFYLERSNRLTWFNPNGKVLETNTETLDGGVANKLDPMDLLRCQLLQSKVERDGQKLTLNERGKALAEDHFAEQVRRGESSSLLNITDYADRKEKKGDRLEIDTATIILKLGVPCVQRSLRLKVSQVSLRKPHAEVDLLFNWNGRLWLVDCKNRISEDDLIARLRRALAPPVSEAAKALLKRIGDELKQSATKTLKEDISAIDEMGGLLGKVVCVRKKEMPEEALAFANRNGIEVVLKQDLEEGFRRLLFPDRPPSQERLQALQRQFSPQVG